MATAHAAARGRVPTAGADTAGPVFIIVCQLCRMPSEGLLSGSGAGAESVIALEGIGVGAVALAGQLAPRLASGASQA